MWSQVSSILFCVKTVGLPDLGASASGAVSINLLISCHTMLWWGAWGSGHISANFSLVFYMYSPLQWNRCATKNTCIHPSSSLFMAWLIESSGELWRGFGSMWQKSHMPPKACVWDFLNHCPLPAQYRYRFTTFFAGAQGLFTHPVVQCISCENRRCHYILTTKHSVTWHNKLLAPRIWKAFRSVLSRHTIQAYLSATFLNVVGPLLLWWTVCLLHRSVCKK
jgi:hypothetical protein